MHKLTLIAILALLCGSAVGREPKRPANPDRFCENAKELASVTSQLPDYKLSSDLADGAELVTPLKFDPRGLLSAARGDSVCIAVVVSESGAVQDAATYYPKKLALSKKEREQLLALTYSPAKENGQPIKSIVVMKAWLQ